MKMTTAATRNITKNRQTADPMKSNFCSSIQSGSGSLFVLLHPHSQVFSMYFFCSSGWSSYIDVVRTSFFTRSELPGICASLCSSARVARRSNASGLISTNDPMLVGMLLF
jgi:hypothetical protein